MPTGKELDQYSGLPDYLLEELPPIPEYVKEYAKKHGFLWGPEDNPYGVAGYMTYAPNGALLKYRMEQTYWGLMIEQNGYYPIKTPSFGPVEQWKASGHYDIFSEEMLITHTPRGQTLVGRGELATTIYPFLKLIAEYFNSKTPFKIYSTGETKLNFRQTQWQTYTQEYTAHEGHVITFIEPSNVEAFISHFEELAYQIMESVGLKREGLVFREKLGKEKPFYAKSAWGLYSNHFNNLELLGVQYRGSGDFEKHSKSIGKNLTVNGKFPEVFEISWSTDRPFICLLQSAIHSIDDRKVLLLPDHLVPYPAIITPTVKSFGLPERAEIIRNKINFLIKPCGEILPEISPRYSRMTRRYQEADETGIPFVIVIDNKCGDDEFILRERNSSIQISTSIQDLSRIIAQIPWGTPLVKLLRTLYQSKIEQSS